MKKLIFAGLLFIMFGLLISGLIFSSYQKSNAQVNSLDATSFITAKVVENFWRYSFEGNEYEIKKLITATPKDFDKPNGCKIDWLNQARNNQAGKITNTESLKNKSEPLNAVIPSPSGSWSQSLNDMNYISVIDSFKAIKKDIFTPYKIIEQRNNDKEALVKIRYGKKDSLVMGNVDTILLTKTETGEWKIFSVTLDWFLNETNKDFGNPKCDESKESF